MAEEFNPYHVWLGIPPEEQPANHYRLLGIKPFETSGDVIDSAADRQMAHLRTFQSGKHGELTQRLLNEVAAVRICLLDPKKRAAYDQQLRAKLAAASPGVASGAELPAAGGSAIQRQPPRRPTGPVPASPVANIPTAAPLPQQPVDPWDNLLGQPDVKSPSGSGGKSARSAAAKRGANNRNMMIGVGVAVALVAVAGIGLLLLNGSSSDGTLVFDWPAAYRTDTNVSIDGVPQTIPASGPWEYRYPAGSHRIVAEHLAYKLDAHVDLAAGSQQAVPADWKPKAMLVLSWPLSLRIGAELKIDGRVQTISQHEPLEVPVEPGRRTIVITRRNFAPIHTTATIAADGREVVSIAAPPTTAKLAFDWPAAERKDAELIVDGQRQTVASESDSAPFELTLPIGQHVVYITRTGFEPFNQSVDLSAGAENTIKPTWTPEKKIAAAPAVADTPVPVETIAPQPPKKLPIPAAAEQEKIAKQLNDLYKTSQPGPKDPAKAQELYDVAAKDGSSPNERYMLLIKGAEIAAMAGDLDLSLQGIDTLDADYDIDALEDKQKLLEKFIAAGKPDQVAIAIPTAEQLVDQAVAADRFDIAVVLATSASKAVAKSKIATHKEVEERLSRRRHDIHLLEPIYTAAKKAQETLEKTPADPEANLTIGRWRCFYKGDWTNGLPMLARGSDEKLKALAEQEIKSPTDADQQVQIADAWWDLAQKEAGIARDSLHLHAGSIYQGAIPNLASALKKAAIEKRLAEIADLKPLPAVAAPVGPPLAVKFPLGRWVDVLRLIDPSRDRVNGAWRREGAEVIGEVEGGGRLAMPLSVDGGYDLEVEFTRTWGTNVVGVNISVGGHDCSVTLSAFDGALSGLTTLDGRSVNDSGNPTVVRPGTVENGRRSRLLICVRVLAVDRASIDVSLDGKPYLPHWEGNPAALNTHDDWRLPDPKSLGFVIIHSNITIHSARLRMVSGRASLDPAVAAPFARRRVPSTDGVEKSPGTVKFPLGKWVEVLRLVDTTKNVVAGKWSRSGNSISVEPSGGARIAIPVAVEGSYDLEARFTRVEHSDEIETAIPVGSRALSIMLGGGDGTVSGFDTVDGRRPFDDGNPTTVHSRDIVNGQECLLLVKVRLRGTDQASVDVFLNGMPHLPHWEGNQSALAVNGWWSMPTSDHPGLGAWNTRATFSSVRLRMISGHASADASVAESAPPQVAPAAVVSEKPSGPSKFALNKWVDVLRLVDTTQNAVKGKWSRAGKEITTEPEHGSRIVIPVAAEGSNDLEVVLVRQTGETDIATTIPVGSHACNIIMGWNRDVGLDRVNGERVHSEKNPTKLISDQFENGQVYRLLAKVRMLDAGRASVDAELNGKPIVRWKGDPAVLSFDGAWAMPTTDHFGLGAWDARVTFKSARLRMVSGSASADASVAGTGSPGARPPFVK